MSDANKDVVRRVFEEAVNTGKLELLNGLIAEDYTSPSGASATGPEAFVKPIRALSEAFPDIRYQLKDMIAEGDQVAVRWTWSGTHRNVYRGPTGVYPPTGKQLANDGMAVFQVSGGKVRRAWLLTDRLGFLQEVGGVPRP